VSRHFAAEKLSDEGRALIAGTYQDGYGLSEISTELASTTGEVIALASLHRYCVRLMAEALLEYKRNYFLGPRR